MGVRKKVATGGKRIAGRCGAGRSITEPEPWPNWGLPDDLDDLASWLDQQLPPDAAPSSAALADLLDALPDLPELDRA